MNHDFTGPWTHEGLICVMCGFVPRNRLEAESDCQRFDLH